MDTFIEPHRLPLLQRLLRGIPALAADLRHTRTKQARLGSMGGSQTQKRIGQPLPYHVDAAKIADKLHAELVGWVRLVCEQRAIAYQGPTGTGGLALWLERHIYSLACTEGADDCYPNLRAIADAAEAIVCPPAFDIVVDSERVDRARRWQLNAAGIATVARELGEEYRQLTRRRVFVLKDAGEIAPLPGPWQPGYPVLFLLGDVLDAHLRVPIRARHAKAS
ncbi:hypothetical protein ACFXG4_04855 [Nocardia sp. NPDC059246]|uniref:hypothetical protein n=1 Tax=unclassified Nocardia TaxID=2637762 RepID=UPI00368A4FCC